MSRRGLAGGDASVLGSHFRCRALAILGSNLGTVGVGAGTTSVSIYLWNGPHSGSTALVRELRLLQRRTARSGKDSVDQGVGGSDDLANALCGALYLISKAASGPAISLDAWTRILSDIRETPPSAFYHR
jgi:hypothetical protein